MKKRPVWLFDLDNTLHDASHAAFTQVTQAMTDYMVTHLDLTPHAADQLRRHYWGRYGATLLGLTRHHGVAASHFLHETHRLPGLEQRLRTSSADRAALKRLPGRKIILTNAPLAYTTRVLRTLRLAPHFDAVLSIEHMRMFGALRPKPDARMLRYLCARLKTPPSGCTLVEDTLVNQRSAHTIGMRTVWMQRYLRRAHVGVHPCHRPPYVCARINALHKLCKL